MEPFSETSITMGKEQGDVSLISRYIWLTSKYQFWCSSSWCSLSCGPMPKALKESAVCICLYRWSCALMLSVLYWCSEWQTDLWHTSYTSCVFSTMPYTIRLCPTLENTINAGYKSFLSGIGAPSTGNRSHLFNLFWSRLFYDSRTVMHTCLLFLLLLTMKRHKLLTMFKCRSENYDINLCRSCRSAILKSEL